MMSHLNNFREFFKFQVSVFNTILKVENVHENVIFSTISTIRITKYWFSAEQVRRVLEQRIAQALSGPSSRLKHQQTSSEEQQPSAFIGRRRSCKNSFSEHDFSNTL